MKKEENLKNEETKDEYIKFMANDPFQEWLYDRMLDVDDAELFETNESYEPIEYWEGEE